MNSIVEKIIESGIVAVIRVDSPTRAVEVCRTCKEGGIVAIEVTFSVPRAVEVIGQLSRELGNEILLGAGTVLDPYTAKIAIEAGARYIVAPNLSEETALLCNKHRIPYVPGVLTPTEIVRALEVGCELIKLFPASAVGPNYIKAIHGPLPQARLMPTGGIGLENVKEWIKAGAAAVGVGGGLTKGSEEEIRDRARRFVELIREARNEIAGR
ncbi:MAG: 2-dehydro-3-deoxyphosphogluconate aldolase/4-hydroxy-2-oxoglutarate aldolase [Thermotoga sp. 50_1627]|uniref:bifunctional 4-hydroxy-2-oxoglutarate aldolase/2-dehydro-3-deoxy-phosphogluconate aldolase n=1 Tax=Pseudothermotoga sp. TaxID=2033661 RepID=UPI00076C5FD3|nr:MAG: 2-dehydro-3-deoxyphosphogluconate aldolase/4-hydroxy-2-oxoglutarate aldolase [Thermotoga sp. 50_64]KUK25430.1 MAG: 2-dehydro-3-deoxyphosphogluconate aldolase/4-hydroxy-2-oxoglutarate aldolase [Thermotoga sp. 50_1627]MBC7116749.1 bifunctional 2-keto-4-hydroxyglutarate aldolase/2-keto-3-deoxy-6-phosphogluconate aldolase [Pseudothermotoga sp.]MDK2923390.1 2-dehydro-3-deoxyphosphogluconate aldolase / (4S)-4-hydroxy-2-oxoglutarate aldolase [Pseudothermotoga sp.]HBT39579.1 2-dehydro-3-deoxyph